MLARVLCWITTRWRRPSPPPVRRALRPALFSFPGREREPRPNLHGRVRSMGPPRSPAALTPPHPSILGGHAPVSGLGKTPHFHGIWSQIGRRLIIPIRVGIGWVALCFRVTTEKQQFCMFLFKSSKWRPVRYEFPQTAHTLFLTTLLEKNSEPPPQTPKKKLRISRPEKEQLLCPVRASPS